MKKFYFIRHAESLWNIQKLCQGTQDIELSPDGIKSSLAFAKALSTFPVKCICTSPLKRALQTAEMIHAHHPDAHLEQIDELKERHWGMLEGMSSEQMYAIEEREESDPSFDPEHGVESRAALKSRIIRGLDKAFALHPTPLVVSHGRLFLVLCELLNIPTSRQLPNLTLIEVKNNGLGWNATPVNLGG